MMLIQRNQEVYGNTINSVSFNFKKQTTEKTGKKCWNNGSIKISK